MFPLLHKWVTLRTGVYESLAKIQTLPTLTDAAKAAVASVAGNSSQVATLHEALAQTAQVNPDAAAALAAPAVPGKAHPFLQWLANGGWQEVYNAVAAILAALGVIHLPPLPTPAPTPAPTPSPTVPAAAGSDVVVPPATGPPETVLGSIA